jgi:thioesterase domain-containing protein
MKTPREIETFFHERIPLTRAMGVCVENWDALELVLSAPLSQNFNHLGTAFGGSINALAILCGYGVLWLELGRTEAHVVIRESRMSFLRPVRHDLRAVCKRPEAEAIAALKTDLVRRGKARLSLSVELKEDATTAAVFEGSFVAMV